MIASVMLAILVDLCVDGLFKDVVGNGPCAECEDGHDSASNRQYCIPCNANQFLFDEDGVHNCVNCPTNSKSDQASEGAWACSCDAGYARVSDNFCEACALGFTKPTAGNTMSHLSTDTVSSRFRFFAGS